MMNVKACSYVREILWPLDGGSYLSNFKERHKKYIVHKIKNNLF